MNRTCKRQLITLLLGLLLLFSMAFGAQAASLKISKKSVSVTAGKTISLKVTGNGNQKVLWSSSNSKVAKVTQAGVVTGLKKGTAKITAKINKKTKVTCKVTVKAPALKLKINKSFSSLYIGQKLSLKVTGNAGNKIKWSTKNKKVATVSSKGVVTAVRQGTTTITAKVLNKKISCKVTVKKKPQPAAASKAPAVETVSANGKTYRLYHQSNMKGYLLQRGCVCTAVAITASAYGSPYSHSNILNGPETAAYSIRHAAKQLGGSVSGYNQLTLSTRGASQILTNMNIPNRLVGMFTYEQAVRDIEANLKAGNPVIVKTHNRKVNGIQMANAHHAMVLIAMDSEGYVTAIDPFYGKVNYAHASHNTFHMTLSDLVKNHMLSNQKEWNGPYTSGIATQGGYILVGTP